MIYDNQIPFIFNQLLATKSRFFSRKDWTKFKPEIKQGPEAKRLWHKLRAAGDLTALALYLHKAFATYTSSNCSTAKYESYLFGNQERAKIMVGIATMFIEAIGTTP